MQATQAPGATHECRLHGPEIDTVRKEVSKRNSESESLRIEPHPPPKHRACRGRRGRAGRSGRRGGPRSPPARNPRGSGIGEDEDDDGFGSSKKKEEVKTFQKRKRRSGQGESLEEGESTQIGRIPVIVPGRPDRDELFYLRLLLHNVPGPTGWDFLKTVQERKQLDDGSWETQTTVCDTFYQACVLRGLCEGMNDAKEALREAMTIKFGSLLRHFFVTLVANGMVGDAPALFEEFKDDLCEDRETRPLDARATPAMINKALVEMKGMFADLGVDWAKTKLPEPDVASFDVGDFLSRELQEEANRRIDLSNQNTDEKIQMMNSGQRKLVEEVIHSVKEKQGRLFAVDAPGGTGKTFTISTLLDKVRKDGYIAVATAYTGIAAILLPGLGTSSFLYFFL